MFELLALDIDGTLISYDNPTITERNKESIRKVKERGVKIVLITGRNYESMKHFNKELSLDGYLMTINGGVVVDSATEDIISEIHIEKKIADQIIGDFEEAKVPYIVFSSLKLYVREEYKDLDTVRLLNTESGKITFIEKYEDIRPLMEVHKIVAISPTQRLEAFIDKIQSYSGDTLHLDFGFEDHLDIYPSNANKGLSLKKLAERLNLDLENVLAIGDAQTDIPMIQAAGLGIAMGNAPEDVKEIADYVTKTAEDDGVAYALDKFILNGKS